MGRNADGLITRRIKNPETGVYELTTYDQEATDAFDASQPTPEQILQEKREKMVVSPWQICKALDQWGFIDTVEMLVANSNSKEMQYGWTRATRFERLNQFIGIMAYYLDMTEEDVDALFVLAATL